MFWSRLLHSRTSTKIADNVDVEDAAGAEDAAACMLRGERLRERWSGECGVSRTGCGEASLSLHIPVFMNELHIPFSPFFWGRIPSSRVGGNISFLKDH